jgi:hypothetical protein
VHRLKKEQTYLGLPHLRYPLAADSYDKARPVFPYPAIAKWNGQGDRNKAETWVKALP